jgi:PAS domain S-box-containing protein
MKNKRRQLSGFVRRLLTGVSLPIVVVDPRTGTINYVNPAFEDLCGKMLPEVRGAQLTTLFGKSHHNKLSAIADVMKKPGTGRLEETDCELIRRSGRKIPVTVNASRVRLGERNWLVVSLQDLTHIKRLQHRREMDIKEMAQISKLADIGLLAAGVAHELNNPLMIVQGYAENIDMLLDQTHLSVSELKSQTAEILRATDRMSRIISQMTRMVRSTDIKFELIDLQEIAQNVLRFLNHEIRHSGVEVETAFATENLIRCDHSQVEQVIMNILSNAVHALEARKDGREIRIGSFKTGSEIELRIWNNGPPIPEAVRDKVMAPFFTTKEVGKGTGLGLAVSFGIMKAHGGSLTFESDEDAGTEFRLCFPAPEIEPVELGPRAHHKVLLVDDDPQALEVLSNKVSLFGFQVVKVRSGAEAFRALAEESSIVAVFTDLRMPDMDGLNLCRHIRRLYNPGPLVYAVTGYTISPAVEKDLQAAGISGVLTKPINHNAFSAVMFQIDSRKDSA